MINFLLSLGRFITPKSQNGEGRITMFSNSRKIHAVVTESKQNTDRLYQL